MIVRPDDGVPVGAADVEPLLLSRSRRHGSYCRRVNEGSNFGCLIIPIQKDSKVKDDVLTSRRYQKAVYMGRGDR